jgi:two-component system nitrate/nitrite response regulator NarL
VPERLFERATPDTSGRYGLILRGRPPSLESMHVRRSSARRDVSAASRSPSSVPALTTGPTVLVADDRPTARLGIAAALEDGHFQVVAQAATAAEAVAGAAAHRPDACVVDVSIAGGGLSAARAISTLLPATGIVVLAAAPTDEELLGALRAGAAAYLPNAIGPGRLRAAVQAVVAGDAAIPREMIGCLLAQGARRRRREPARFSDREVSLSPREWEAIELLRLGRPTREIAEQLGISVVTVRRHVSEALRKLGAPDRATALRLLEDADKLANVG